MFVLYVYWIAADGPNIVDHEESTEIICPEGSFLGNNPLSSDATVIQSHTFGWNYFMSHCFGRGESCFIPHDLPLLTLNATMGENDLHLVCNVIGGQLIINSSFVPSTIIFHVSFLIKEHEKCRSGESSQSSTIFTVTDYIKWLDRKGSCTWSKKAEDGQFLMLNVSKIALAVKAKDYYVITPLFWCSSLQKLN